LQNLFKNEDLQSRIAANDKTKADKKAKEAEDLAAKEKADLDRAIEESKREEEARLQKEKESLEVNQSTEQLASEESTQLLSQ
jgi:hypothetical protein